MDLSDPDLENDLVSLEILGPDRKGLVEKSGVIPAMWDWMPMLPKRGTSFNAYFEHTMCEAKAGRQVPFLAFRKSDNVFVGGAAFVSPSQTHRSVEIGYLWITPDMRGTHAFAAMQAALVRRAMEWRARRIVWKVDTENTAFMRSMDRMGVTREGVLRSYARLNAGRWSDMAIYAAVRDEIPFVLSRLESFLALAD